LEYPEKEQKAVTGAENTTDVAISISNLTCYWNHVKRKTTFNKSEGTGKDIIKSSEIQALSNVSIKFLRGELNCVIGTVGSGKSALLQAVIGELSIFSGNIERSYKTLAYASQDPWIMDGTVMENITMGLDLDEKWYNNVVEACGLALDFSQFLNGDQTIVGDRGVQCSGGQRARIGLARALYRDANVLVVDDPLSAVDAEVGRQIFNEALMKLGVNRGKCVILATHQHQYVMDKKCVLMRNGHLEKIGSYSECVAAAGGKIITAHSSINDATGTFQDKTEKIKGKLKVNEKLIINAEKDYDEDKVSGQVKIDTYKDFARAMGGLWIAFLCLILFTMTQVSLLVTIATMGRWSERPIEKQTSWGIVASVISLVLVVVVLAVFRAIISFMITVKASRKLHDDMTEAVLRAQISFFDTNPMGRILNRFSADVGSNDDLLPQTLFDFLVIFFMALGTVVTTAVILPFTIIALPPLMYYFLYLRRVFVTSTRELKRLEGLSRSPIFAMLSESLSGMATIRANDSIDYFNKKFESAHDSHTKTFFYYMACSRWVGFRMDSIVFLLLCLVSFLSVLMHEKGWFDIDPPLFGLSISLLVQLAGIFQWCFRQSAEVVNQMVSVERVLGFGKLEPEAPLILEADKLIDSSWPNKGAIEVNNISIRYRPTLPLALNKVSFSIPGGSRVGVVGRTGSGKSTIVQTLFRLLESDNGSICIDGIDISQVGLHRLRTKISVIPQVPTLFSGCTVRENLDLFGLHTEEAIQKALDDVHLSEAISKLPEGKNSLVSEGGSNFSVGQRQLLCLARAILSKNKLLVLDEATASVDRRTDQLLHQSLHRSFSKATIIAIAHRLDTVIDYDYILVLGEGKLIEFGPPAELLNAGGAFSKMVDDTGESMSKDLRFTVLKKEREIFQLKENLT